MILSKKYPLLILLTGLALAGALAFVLFFSGQKTADIPTALSVPILDDTQKKELETLLDEEAYEILVNKGTEEPFSSPLNDEKRPGTYVAKDTGKPVFRSEDKYDSGTGWPSFTKPITPDAILVQDDFGIVGRRTEVLSTGGGHLGHVFPDGPDPTGLRYCMNGDALTFIPDAPVD